jgi:hypothetical protein
MARSLTSYAIPAGNPWAAGIHKTVAQFVPAGESTGGHQSLGQGMLFEKSYVGELMGAGVTAISLFGNKISTN